MTSNPKILIVEDEDKTARSLHKCLTNFKYDVVGTVSTGEAAIAAAVTNLPDLVLINVRLKGSLEGIEAASTLRLQYGAAIVFVSSYIDDDLLRRAGKAEPFGYIIKPIEERELHTTLELALYRRELERRYKESEAWYRTTLRSIGEAVIATDAAGMIKFMNSAAEILTGWKMNEALGEELLKIFRTKKDLDKLSVINPVDQILRNKITAVLKNHDILMTRDGRELPIDESASPIKDELGNIVGVVLVFEDVAERKRAQEALRISQDYAQNIINSSMDMVIAVDLERKITEFNEAAERTFGYKKTELLGQHISILYADPEEAAMVNKRVNESGRDIMEVWNRRRNGEIFPCLLSSAVLRNVNGEKIGYMGMSRDITDTKQAEEKLIAAQDYAQSIIGSSLDMIIAVNKNRQIVEFNKAAEEVFGYEAREVLGANVNMLYSDPEEGISLHNSTIEKGRCIQEVLNKRKSGEIFPSLVSSSVLRNLKGEMIGVMAILRDVTEKKLVDQALRESEERYRSLVDLSPDPIVVHIGSKLVFVNAAAVQIFAADSLADLIGRSIIELIHPEYRVAVKNQMLFMMNERKPMQVTEATFNKLDGKLFEAEVSGMTLSWEGRTAIQMVLHDITDRRRVENAIRGSESKYRSLIENILDGVYQTTPDGEILTANPALARLLGYDNETDLLLLNMERDLYVNPEERRDYLSRLVKGEEVKNAEFKLRRKDGQIITVLENARVVRNGPGDILYFEGTMTDITELKRAQEALRMSKDRFRVLIDQTQDPIWCFEFTKPMPTGISEDRQIKYLMEEGILTECNDATACLCGMENSRRALGIKLKDFLDPTKKENIDFIRSFIRSGYRLINKKLVESGKKIKSMVHLNNLIGTVEGNALVRIWGTRRSLDSQPGRTIAGVSGEKKSIRSIAPKMKLKTRSGRIKIKRGVKGKKKA